MSTCEQDNSINDWISYVMIGVGTFFSALSIVVIVANIFSMWRNSYARMMLLIQVLYLSMCIVDIPIYDPYDPDACRFPGAFFYFFWMVRDT